MNRLLSLAICIFTACLLANAQELAPAPKPLSISGMVVQEPGSHPIKKVLVQVVAENQKEGGNYTGTTDAEGRFQIENVTPGRYRLFIEKTGFVGVNGRGVRSDMNVVTVQAGQSIADLIFRLLPTAIISGRITDEDGDPMSGIRVVALRKIPGKAKRQALGSEATNDLGEYRISGLSPGQYWVVAMPAPDFRDYEQEEKPLQTDKRNDATSDTRYLPTYYPGTYDAGQASVLSLKAGDEMPINITLVPTRTYRVRGIVTGLTAGQKSFVELVSKSGDSLHASEVGSGGEFEVRGVGPGSYVLRAVNNSDSQPASARLDVTVISGDVEGLKLTPQLSFTISGHLSIDGPIPGGLTQFNVNLRASELREDSGFFMSPEFFGANASVDRFGNFEWKQVNAGEYVVRVNSGDSGNNFFLKSVRLQGRDIETGFTASGPLSIDLTVSSKAGTIEGAVNEKEKDVDKSYPVANATVVAVPEERYRKLTDHFGVGESDQQGRFIIRGLAPGSYSLYAWQDVGENVYRDSDFLKTQEANGLSVTVGESSHQTVELKVSPVAEEWR